MKKIIVFGASGNIGSYLVDYLYNSLDKSLYEICPVGRRNTDFFERYGMHYYSVDISKFEDFSKLPKEDVYAIINLSGILPADMVEYNPRAYLNINLIGGFNVLEYCRIVHAERILYSQTIAEVANSMYDKIIVDPYMKRDIIMDNDHTVYAIAKCAVVDLMENYNRMYGLKTFVMRLPNIYMDYPTDYCYVDGKIKYSAYRTMINRAIAGEDIELWGDPNNARDVVYVKDLCQIFAKALFVNKNSARYNIGTGHAITLEEEIQGIIDVFSPKDKKVKIIPRPDKSNRPGYTMDVSNAISELGFKPMTYMEMLAEFKKEIELDRFADLRRSK